MLNVLILGAGKIGSTIAHLLTSSSRYKVTIADVREVMNDNCHCIAVDINNSQALDELFKNNQFIAVISCLPFYCNVLVAEKARKYQVNYFDLTEDTQTTRAIQEIAKDASVAFIPQCGIAPGFINIAAHDLMQPFDLLETVKLRVGAIPENTSNSLHYALTWSTDGIINEYGNPCHTIVNGQTCMQLPLTELETILINGVTYEAFHTSGGLGTLADTYKGKVVNMDYKTIRYPGHCEKMYFLMNDLKLNQQRSLLKTILENAIPTTQQDVVILYISIAGKKADTYIESNYHKAFYPQIINGKRFSAIQVATAYSVCATVDITLHNQDKYRGFIKQENFSLYEFVKNSFGEFYA